MQLHIEGEPQLQARLQKVIERIGNLQPTFTKVGETMVKFYSTQPFLSQGGVYGQPWEPLQDRYAAYKERKYPGRGILVATGKMQDSFKARASSSRVEITNSADYFAKHQLGKGVPQRVSMMLDEQRRRLAIKTINTDLSLKIKEAW